MLKYVCVVTIGWKKADILNPEISVKTGFSFKEFKAN